MDNPQNERFQRLRKFVPALLDMGKVGSGLFARNVLRGLFKLLLAGFLAPGQMGVLRSVLAFFRITTSLFEFGLKYAMVAFVPKAIGKGDTAERDRILMATLSLRLGSIAMLLVLGNLLAETAARVALGDPSLVLYARLAVFGAGGQLLWQFQSGYHSSRQDFGRMAFFLTTVPLLMLATALALAAFGRLDLQASILISLFAPLATVILWLPAIDFGFFRRSSLCRAMIVEILRFSRWVYLTNVASSLRGHLNPLLLKSPALSGSVAAGELNAGLYGFGNDLANEMQMLSGTITTVLMPKASSKTDTAALRRFTRRCYMGIPFLIAALIPVMYLAKPALLLLSRLSPIYLEYLPSLAVFRILYIGGLFSIAGIPMMTVLYAMKLPQVAARIELAMVPVLVVGGILLIPIYGVAGAAISILVQRVIFFVVIFGYGLIRLREPRSESDS